MALRPSDARHELSPHGQVTGAYSSWPRYGTDSGDETSAAIAEARRLVQAERAESTRDRYARDWALFVAWVAEAHSQHLVLPAPAPLIGLYIGVLRTRGLAKQTILGRLAAIAYAHELAGLPSPLKQGDLYRQIRGLRRQVEEPRQAHEALVREQATGILERLAPPNTLQDVRDRAIFSLAWCSALRRSNIAAMRRKDVKIQRDPVDGTRYLEIFVPRSKTDQEGRGRRVIVTELPPDEPLCAVRAVETWLSASGIADGALFRTFSLHRDEAKRHLQVNAIDGRDVARVVKRLAAQTGVDPTMYAAHSMRRGFVTSADAAGVRRSLIREQGGWKDDRMISVYTRVENVRENALRDLFRKK